jgi:hypothetical protein
MSRRIRDHQLLEAGWRAGWAAACIELAEACEGSGQAEQGRMLREMAEQPANMQPVLVREGESSEDAIARVQREKGGDA